jgi:2-dehydropantoate 2-reductase
LREQIWLKLLGNAVFNPLSVLTRATLAAMCRHPGTRALARVGMQECLAVAAALGARPEIEIERRIDGAERVGEHRTSTLQDLEAGKRLELDALLVAVVELADLTGTPAPTLQALAAESTLLAASLGLS